MANVDRGRGFIITPLVLMLAYVAGCIILRGEPRFVYVFVTVAKLLGGVGLLAAALKYNRQEYLFWAWAMLAANFVFLGLADLLFSKRYALVHLEPVTAEKAWALFVVISNVIAAVGTLMLARVWRVVGVALPDPTPAKQAAVIAGIIVSVAVVGWVTVPDFEEMLKGSPSGFVGVIGALSDVVCFSIIAPLVLRALAMRGGRLAWPWGLLAASGFAWLIFDVLIEMDWHISDSTARVLTNGARVLACLLSMAAGLAQRWAISVETTDA